MQKINLEHVKYMPKGLEQGILYVSLEFSTAAHLCACGCGNKINTPLKPTEWSFADSVQGPSLYPSIGNWQLPCQSHYWIQKGEILWSNQWTEEQILAGRQSEQRRREAHYQVASLGCMVKIWNWFKALFK